MSKETKGCDLIVTIVKKGFSEQIIQASIKAGAKGGTVVFGRGTGIHEQKKILGIPIEPEKEIVLTVVSKKQTDTILKAITDAGELDKPGMGIGFVISLDRVTGMCHLLSDGTMLCKYWIN